MAKLQDMEVDEFYAVVGGRVRSLRTDAGMSQSMLAQHIGFTRSSVANLEAGRQKIALHLFVRIARALDREPATLLPDESVTTNTDVLRDLHEHLSDEPDTGQEFVRGAVAQLAADSDGKVV
jgi:transcriptional regulator with XRE-family HTH domain